MVNGTAKTWAQSVRIKLGTLSGPAVYVDFKECSASSTSFCSKLTRFSVSILNASTIFSKSVYLLPWQLKALGTLLSLFLQLMKDQNLFGSAIIFSSASEIKLA